MSYKAVPKNPYKTILWDLVDELLTYGCSGPEVAARIGVSPDTLYDRCKLEKNSCFSEHARKQRENGKALLREKQFKKALNLNEPGCVKTLLHLSKHVLGEKDAPHIAMEAPKNLSGLLIDIMSGGPLQPDSLSTNEPDDDDN